MFPETWAAYTMLFNLYKQFKSTEEAVCARPCSESQCYSSILVNDAWHDAERSACKWVGISYSGAR